MSRLYVLLVATAFALFAFVANQAEAGSGYKLRAGDTLRIEVLEDPALNRTVLVAPDGRISIPYVGGLRVSGRTIDAVRSELTAKLSPNFAAAPSVYVALERQREIKPVSRGPVVAPTIDVFVMGEATKPGKLEVAPGTTILQLFAQMGGFNKFAAVKRVQLRRGTKVQLLNYKKIESGTSNAGSIVLSDGDVIVVPQRKLFE